MNCLIGVDIGTQGTKAALFDETGRCLAQAFEASRLLHPEPDVVEEDPEAQYGSVCATVKRCIEEAGVPAGRIAGIAIDGQMAGVIGVGRDGRCVTPYDSWLDTRCSPYIKRMNERAGDEVLKKTGCAPSINHGPKILWWKGRRKDVYKEIAAFVQPGGYAAMRLCGLSGDQAYIDATYLHFSGFADNKRADWDADLCKEFGVSQRKLPRIVPPEQVVGQVTAEAAARSGLQAGTPVVAGCGDTSASFLAAGATRAGVLVDVAGTASVFAATASAFRPDVEARVLGCGRSAVPDLWHPYAYINGGGMNLEWLRRAFGAGGDDGSADLDALSEAAAKLPWRDDDPLSVPHWGGRVCPPEPDLRGAWAGLTWSHGSAHLYRAVLEGVALEYAIYLRALKGVDRAFRPTELRATGGGARSAFWRGIKADALQIPVREVSRDEGAPLGCALLAGFGVGMFPSLAAAAEQWIQAGEARRPVAELGKYFEKRLARYESLMAKLASL